MKIRKSKLSDLDQLMDIFAHAREFMKENGNPSQWGDNWPEKDVIISDIKQGNSYVVIDEEDNILATYAYIIGVDKTYLQIDGAWLSNNSYGTIHRLASSCKQKGIFDFIIQHIEQNKLNIRVDTHKNNKVMIHLLEKNGFSYCGLIAPIEGGIRVAYEKEIS